MIADSYIVPECVIGPGSFGGLMALYESNFIKLDMLVGEFGECGEPGDCRLSAAARDRDLYLTVMEATRYTRTFRMTYLFDEPDADSRAVAGASGVIADPELLIRVYLDARMAEVAGWAEHHRHGVLGGLANRFRRELDRRWSNNMMLSKWLDFLLDARHSFGRGVPVADPLAAPHAGMVDAWLVTV